jgi:hypothetical protein
VQDLQSLALHEEAIRLIRQDPALRQQAEETLGRWLRSGSSHASTLWKEWQDILRHSVLDQISGLKKGVVLGNAENKAAP